MICLLAPEIKTYFSPHPFTEIMQLKGEVFRSLENRCTQRIFINGQYYFIKQHFGIGWKEIFKNLLQWRLPVFNAKNEWQAISILKQHSVGVAEWVGYGVKGINPAKQSSFLITREINASISLEELTKTWRTKPPHFKQKQQLIKEVARIARIMHAQGINHRDFYICHFLLDQAAYAQQHIKLYLIDLHRAQWRNKVPVRWLIKDLAGLYFSSKCIGLTRRDILRFIQEYRNTSDVRLINQEAAFWHKVKVRGEKLFQKEIGAN